MREQRLCWCVFTPCVFSSPAVLPPFIIPFCCFCSPLTLLHIRFLILFICILFYMLFLPPSFHTVVMPCVTWIWLLPCTRCPECWFQVWGRRTCLRELWRRRCAASLVSTCSAPRMLSSSMCWRWEVRFKCATFSCRVFCAPWKLLFVPPGLQGWWIRWPPPCSSQKPLLL